MNTLKILMLLFSFLTMNQLTYGQSTTERRWKISATAGGQLANYLWDSPDQTLTDQFPKYRPKLGFIGGVKFENNLHKSLYIKYGVDYLITNMALETGGQVLIVSDQGTKIVQCNWIDKRTQQLMANLGLGYQVIPSLSLEISVFGITDLSIEESSVCDFTSWQMTYGQERNSGFGFSPSIVYRFRKFNITGAYGFELSGNRGTWFTDANGQDLGKFANRMQYFSLRFGYQII